MKEYLDVNIHSLKSKQNKEVDNLIKINFRNLF